MKKLHHGELIGLLKMRGHFTYREIADGVGKKERTVQYWEGKKELPMEIRLRLAEFFLIDVAAFDQEKVREVVASKYTSNRVSPFPLVGSSAEKEIPVKLTEIEKHLLAVEKMQREMMELLIDLRRKK